MKISRRKENKCISGRMVHSEKIDFLAKEYGEKDRLMEKKQENHNRQGRKHAGIPSGFCTKNILFCTNSEKFCTKT